MTQCTYKVRHKEADEALVKSIQQRDKDRVRNIDLLRSRLYLLVLLNTGSSHTLVPLTSCMLSWLTQKDEVHYNYVE